LCHCQPALRQIMDLAEKMEFDKFLKFPPASIQKIHPLNFFSLLPPPHRLLHPNPSVRISAWIVPSWPSVAIASRHPPSPGPIVPVPVASVLCRQSQMALNRRAEMWWQPAASQPAAHRRQQ
jgi:hypothetical protein